MRTLIANEYHQVSGGVNCLDHETWQNINNVAKKDGVTFSVIATPMVMAAAAGLSLGAPAVIIAGAIVAPWAAAAGYFNSAAWNIV